MGKGVDERSHKAIRAYLKHKGIEVLEENWAHGSDSIDSIPWMTRSSSSWTPPSSAGLRHAQGGTRLGTLRAHRGDIPRRVRDGGPHQHPLRHREPCGDELQEGPPAPPQERPQRRRATSKRLPRAFGLGVGQISMFANLLRALAAPLCGC